MTEALIGRLLRPVIEGADHHPVAHLKAGNPYTKGINGTRHFMADRQRNLYLSTFVIALIVIGCTPERFTISEEFQEQTTLGAFPKLVDVETDFFDFSDPENAAYAHSVDFIDGAEGRDVSEYRIYLSYEPLGQPDTVQELFRTVTSREFITRSETGQLGFDLVIPFSEVADFLGLDALSDFTVEDKFNFRTEIVKFDNRVFSSLNSTPAITNAFEGLWNFEVSPSCPVGEDMFVGEYQVTYGYTYSRPDIFGDELRAFGLNIDRAVFLSPTDDPLRRRFNYGPYITSYSFFTNDVFLNFACENLTQSPVSVGAGCGDGSIGAIQNGVATYDPNDDSTFTIELIDLPPEFDGGCFGNGFGNQLRYSLVFTKI